MATLFDWAKLVIENKWLIILLFGSVTGAVGNVTQYFQVEAKSKEIKATRQQVTAVANAYSQTYQPEPVQGEHSHPEYDRRLKQLERFH